MAHDEESARRFERVGARTALVGVALGAVSGLLLWLAVDDVIARVGILELVEDQSLVVQAGPGAAELFRWGYLADMLGYYLLWLPLVLALEGRIAASLGSGPARLATISGVLYIGIGALGAVLLATLIPDLLRAAARTGTEAGTASLLARTLVQAVHRGVWQTLDAVTAGTWIILAGVAFRRSGKPGLGWTGILTGCFSFLLAIGWFIDAPGVVLVGLVFLLPSLLWIGGVSRELLRPRPSGAT